jgi:hypothetical protein
MVQMSLWGVGWRSWWSSRREVMVQISLRGVGGIGGLGGYPQSSIWDLLPLRPGTPHVVAFHADEMPAEEGILVPY